MLQHMRRHAKYFYVLFIVVIISFMFWGVGSVDKQSSEGIVAEVAGEKISSAEHARLYEQMLRSYREAAQGQLPPELEKSLRLPERALDSLIANRVLARAAQDLGMSVSDKELQEEITTDPSFTRDGVFRKDVYLRTLQLMRTTPEQFEQTLRRQLLAQKMGQLIASSVELGPSDLQGLPAEQTQNAEVLQNLLAVKQNAAIVSYVEGLKPQMKVKISRDFTS